MSAANKLNKLKAFEYMLGLMYQHMQSIPTAPTKDLSLLKVIKLNFFLTASTTNPEDKGLLSVFDDYYAMPFGHVESGVYNQIGNLEYFSLTASSCVLINLDQQVSEILDTLKDALGELANRIELAFDNFIVKAGHLFTWDAMSLVELSHEWMSWKVIFSAAQRRGKGSMKIPPSFIQKEEKFYELKWR